MAASAPAARSYLRIEAIPAAKKERREKGKKLLIERR